MFRACFNSLCSHSMGVLDTIDSLLSDVNAPPNALLLDTVDSLLSEVKRREGSYMFGVTGDGLFVTGSVPFILMACVHADGAGDCANKIKT